LGCIWYRDDAYLTPNQIGDQFWHLLEMPVCETVLDYNVSAFAVAGLSQTSAEVSQIFWSIAGRPTAKIADHRHRLLCARGQRPSDSAAKSSEKFASPHGLSLKLIAAAYHNRSIGVDCA
jgi:hypothetical protein